MDERRLGKEVPWRLTAIRKKARQMERDEKNGTLPQPPQEFPPSDEEMDQRLPANMRRTKAKGKAAAKKNAAAAKKAPAKKAPVPKKPAAPAGYKFDAFGTLIVA